MSFPKNGLTYAAAGVDIDAGARLVEAIKPLAAMFVETFMTFLPVATYPVRAGVHSNTAFALLLALDYEMTLFMREQLQRIFKRAAIALPGHAFQRLPNKILSISAAFPLAPGRHAQPMRGARPASSRAEPHGAPAQTICLYPYPNLPAGGKIAYSVY